MTLQKDQPKQPTARLHRIVWIVTISIAGAGIIAAVIIAIIDHVRLF
jgi:hypothetical protein